METRERSKQSRERTRAREAEASLGPIGNLFASPAVARVLVVFLSSLLEAVHRGEIPADAARGRLARVGRMPIRLLGDAVLRRRAWDLADRLGWASTFTAEYLTLTQLQADAFVTLDVELARSIQDTVATASIEELYSTRSRE